MHDGVAPGVCRERRAGDERRILCHDDLHYILRDRQECLSYMR